MRATARETDPAAAIERRDALDRVRGAIHALPDAEREVFLLRQNGDLTFEAVQEVGLAHGLVDNKSCSIDDRWQALRFVYRLTDRTT